MKIARALQWPPDALDQIADGVDPESLPTIEYNGAHNTSAATETTDQAVTSMLRALPEDVQRRLRAEIAAAWTAEHGGDLS